MNWIKLSEQQPQEGQPIWMYRNRIAFQEAYSKELFSDKHNWLWQLASVPPPPSNEDEEAFEEWWRSGRDCHFSFTPRDLAIAAWNAALAWERKK